MCRLAFSDDELHRNTGVRPRRSLVEWLRDLWRPRLPQVEETEVIPFPAEAAASDDREGDRRGSKAA